MAYDVGGMGLDTFTPDLEANPLAVSRDLLAPSPDVTGSVYRGMYNALAPIGRGAGSGSGPLIEPTNFDLGFGDSIAGQQIHSDTPGVGNGRMWGFLGPQYNAKEPAPFDVYQTAGVGDPPQRILERAKYMLTQNPDYFRGKNMFLTVGSNDPSQIDATKELFKTLGDAGVGNVVVPGMGPGVRDSAVMNKALQGAVEGAGSNFKFFQPNIDWARDGVHPANSRQMFDQANTTLGGMTASPTPAPVGLQTGGGLQVQPQPINPLVPIPGASPNAVQPGAPVDLPYTGPHADVFNAATKFGVDPELAMTTASIESRFGTVPDTAGSQYRGMFQLGTDEWNQMGGGDRGDRALQIDHGIRLLAQRRQELATKLGRQPTNAEVYLAHQQGVAGATALINNPDTPAGQVVVPSHIRSNGGNPDAPASEFVKHWSDMYDHHLAGLGGQMPPYTATAAVVQPGSGGYRSGQVVPGTGYAVGGPTAAVAQPPHQYGMVTPLVDDNPFAAKAPGQVNTPAQDLSEMNRRERAMQALQMWSVLGGMQRGVKFTPVSYDPFKVKEAGTPQGGNVAMPVEPVGAGSAGPVGWNALQYRMPVRGVTRQTG